MKKIIKIYLLFLNFIVTQNLTNIPVLTFKETQHKNGLILQLSENYKIPYTTQTRSKYKKLFLENPEKLIEENKKYEKQFADDTSIFTPEWFEKEFKDHPIFLISECTTGYCSLNRINNPQHRKKFEDEVINHITKKFDKKQTIILTSFGSGTAFSELLILTKLIDQGYKNIHVNLIDSAWSEYIDILKTKESKINLDIFDFTLPKRGYWLRFHTYFLIQFLSWLKFEKNLNLTFTIYPNSESYNKECANNPNMKSDIIVAVDFYEPEKRWAILDFFKLICGCLKSNGSAFSILSNMFSNEARTKIFIKNSEIPYDILLDAFEEKQYEIALDKLSKIVTNTNYFQIKDFSTTFWQWLKSFIVFKFNNFKK